MPSQNERCENCYCWVRHFHLNGNPSFIGECRRLSPRRIESDLGDECESPRHGVWPETPHTGWCYEHTTGVYDSNGKALSVEEAFPVQPRHTDAQLDALVEQVRRS